MEEPEAGSELREPFAHRPALCGAGSVSAAVSPASSADIGAVQLDLPEVRASGCHGRDRGAARLEGVGSFESELPQADMRVCYASFSLLSHQL